MNAILKCARVRNTNVHLCNIVDNTEQLKQAFVLAVTFNEQPLKCILSSKFQNIFITLTVLIGSVDKLNDK